MFFNGLKIETNGDVSFDYNKMLRRKKFLNFLFKALLALGIIFAVLAVITGFFSYHLSTDMAGLSFLSFFAAVVCRIFRGSYDQTDKMLNALSKKCDPNTIVTGDINGVPFNNDIFKENFKKNNVVETDCTPVYEQETPEIK